MRQRTAFIIPNAIGVVTAQDKVLSLSFSHFTFTLPSGTYCSLLYHHRYQIGLSGLYCQVAALARNNKARFSSINVSCI